MNKSEAITLFETGAGLARAVGLTRGRISQWPEVLTQKQADLVMGAAIRLGRIPPDQSTPTGTEQEPGMAFGEFGETRSGIERREEERRQVESGPDCDLGEPRDGDRRQEDRRRDGGENEAAA